MHSYKAFDNLSNLQLSLCKTGSFKCVLLQEQAEHLMIQVCQQLTADLLEPRDLSYMLPALELIVSANEEMSDELQNATRQFWDTFVVTNLNQLEDHEKISGLELLSAYANAVGPLDMSADNSGDSECRQNATVWVENEWRRMWKSLMSSDNPLDLFAVLRILQLSTPVFPLFKPCATLNRRAVRSAVSLSDLAAVLARNSQQDWVVETAQSFLDFQTELLTTAQLVRLASTLVQLLTALMGCQESDSAMHAYQGYAARVLEATLSVLETSGSLRQMELQERKELHLDFLNLALYVNVRDGKLKWGCRGTKQVVTCFPIVVVGLSRCSPFISHYAVPTL